jgi:YVTN family beta-propeller protein
VSGIGPISGWAFSTVPGAQITVLLRIDGAEATPVPCCLERPDVAQQYGSQALNSGFGEIFNFNRLSEGDHDFEVEVQDGSSVKSEKHKVTVVKPGGFEFLSSLNLFLAQVEVKDQEVVLEGVHAVEKGTNTDQEVTLHLAWQENSQTLGVVKSENTGTSASLSQPTQVQEPATVASEENVATGLTLTYENPPDETIASGIGIISGWTFSPTPGATFPPTVQFRLDDGPAITIPCCFDRPDVAEAFPTQSEQALRSGFGGPFNFNRLTSDSHSIAIEAQDGTGASQSATHKVTVVKLGDFEFLDQFDLSDAEAFINAGTILVLDKVKIRDKATQQTREVSASYVWEESCQCFIAQGSCGDGGVSPTEECDGESLDNQTCESLGFNGGTLTCTATCEFDTDECTGGPRLYVTNTRSNTVSVVNTATNLLSKTISVGRGPRGIAVNPTSPSAYIANFADDTVSVINTATDAVTDTIPLRQGGERKGPQGIVAAPDGSKVYVVNGRDNSVSVIDTLTKSVLTTIPVGRQPQAIALSPDGTRAYVTNFADNSVTMLDTTTNAAISTITVGEGPDGVAISPQEGLRRAYVANFNANLVSAIDTVTNTLMGDPLLVGFQPAQIAFTPDGTRAYVANFLEYTVSVIDAVANAVAGNFFTADQPNGVVVTPNGKRLYISLFGNSGVGNQVQVVSTVTHNTVAPIIKVGEGPFGVAVVP